MTTALKWARRIALAYTVGVLAGAAEFIRETRAWK
jgi:hypothetical protein